MCFKSIKLGNFKIESINNIKDMSNNLNVKLSEANVISAQTYPKEINDLDEATKKLETSKKQYQAKIAYNDLDESNIGAYIRNYKIESLMVTLGRHSKQNDLKDLKLDLKTTKSEGVYDLNITVVGTYEDVYNFLYSIEDDDDLLFDIVNLKVEPYTVKTTTKVTNPDTNAATTTVDNPFAALETITSTDATSTKNNTTTNNTANNTTNNNQTNTTNNTTANNNNTSNNQNTTKTDVIYDPKNVQAEFTIEKISISFE